MVLYHDMYCAMVSYHLPWYRMAQFYHGIPWYSTVYHAILLYILVMLKKKKKSGIVQFIMVWYILPRYNADYHGIL